MLRPTDLSSISIAVAGVFNGFPSVLSSRFARDGHHDHAISRFNITLQVKNLLPGSEHQLAILDRNDEGWPEHGGLQMRMAIAIVPGALVPIIPAGRKQFVESSGKIFLQPRFEFDGADGSSAPDIEDVRQPANNPRGADNFSDGFGEVVHLPVTGSLKRDLMLIDHGSLILPRVDCGEGETNKAGG